MKSISCFLVHVILENIVVGIPYVFYYGTEGDYNVLIMELLGQNLDELASYCGGKFSIKTTLTIAVQALSRIKQIHENYIIHRDIKPDNLAPGLGKHENTIYIYDFGLSKKYINKKTGQHISYKKNKHFNGSIRYASLNAHLGIEQSRRDDLDSLGLVLIYLVKGVFPWLGLISKKDLEMYKKVVKIMSIISSETLCEEMPCIYYYYIVEYQKYFDYVRSLKFEEAPNYKYLTNMFLDKLNREDKSGFTFDWQLKLQNAKAYYENGQEESSLSQVEQFTSSNDTSLISNEEKKLPHPTKLMTSTCGLLSNDQLIRKLAVPPNNDREKDVNSMNIPDECKSPLPLPYKFVISPRDRHKSSFIAPTNNLNKCFSRKYTFHQYFLLKNKIILKK